MGFAESVDDQSVETTENVSMIQHSIIILRDPSEQSPY
jgi:hypothetical protein